MNTNDGESRRSFLQSATVASLALTSVNAATASATPGGARAVGIETAVERLVRDHRFARADALLDRHGVEYDRTIRRLPEVQTPDTDQPTTKDEWNYSESSYAHYAWHSSGDVYRSFSSWVLDGGGSAETSGPNDGIGATVNPDLWEPVLNSWEFSDRGQLHERGSKGVIGEFNDPDGPLDVTADERDGWMAVNFEKTEPGDHNIYGTYTHTWNPFGLPGWASFSLAVGPIGVSVSGEVDTWSKRSDNNL